MMHQFDAGGVGTGSHFEEIPDTLLGQGPLQFTTGNILPVGSADPTDHDHFGSHGGNHIGGNQNQFTLLRRLQRETWVLLGKAKRC